MVSSTSIRSRLQSKVFDKLGTTVILSAFSSSSISKWGDEDVTFSANQNVTAVPYDRIANRLNHQPFGELQEGEVVMIFPYTVTITKDDKVTYESEDFLVTELEEFPYAGDNLATAARLSRIKSTN